MRVNRAMLQVQVLYEYGRWCSAPRCQQMGDVNVIVSIKKNSSVNFHNRGTHGIFAYIPFTIHTDETKKNDQSFGSSQLEHFMDCRNPVTKFCAPVLTTHEGSSVNKIL
mmetsp:Transcript_22191/g.32404  ORF Transcript_22191/g.32404 Transcript_22191/m.32404 type:complete len:109 (-) Transcript_22191:488-814(-)